MRVIMILSKEATILNSYKRNLWPCESKEIQEIYLFLLINFIYIIVTSKLMSIQLLHASVIVICMVERC